MVESEPLLFGCCCLPCVCILLFSLLYAVGAAVRAVLRIEAKDEELWLGLYVCAGTLLLAFLVFYSYLVWHVVIRSRLSWHDLCVEWREEQPPPPLERV